MTVNVLHQLCVLEGLDSRNDQQDEGQNFTIHLCKTHRFVTIDVRTEEISLAKRKMTRCGESVVGRIVLKSRDQMFIEKKNFLDFSKII